ncbi:predicted protein [Streptomyces viridochromogenes DSM 40736]|uniref:Predicted protein n=1 Tax=Streptomyces viridochromogenes (strain DSM 40736 / JCM 4977 / BCRC 1201 / Tue 494) TaxID=591159 RepID=D9XFE2_STRVT|nr:hypothetical protein [Streptomyces viridochromogenes]EFL32645.1 predicted protein [Streptomyces viridochromogenes DSM 40736]
MATAALMAPPYLPQYGPLDLVAVDGTWNAVTVPARWGPLVLDVLADRSEPVLEDPAAGHLLWPVPPGSADTWPDTRTAGIQVHGQGAELLMCGPGGHRDVMQWLRVPTRRHWATDADPLRMAVEFVVGPLPAAVPIQMCTWCGTPTRAAACWAGGMSSPARSGHCSPARRAGRRPCGAAPAGTSASCVRGRCDSPYGGGRLHGGRHRSGYCLHL